MNPVSSVVIVANYDTDDDSIHEEVKDSNLQFVVISVICRI